MVKVDNKATQVEVAIQISTQVKVVLFIATVIRDFVITDEMSDSPANVWVVSYH